MKDFNYYAPTQVVFGRESEEQVAALVNATPHSDQRSENATPHSDQRSEKQYGGTKALHAEDMLNIYNMARG